MNSWIEKVIQAEREGFICSMWGACVSVPLLGRRLRGSYYLSHVSFIHTPCCVTHWERERERERERESEVDTTPAFSTCVLRIFVNFQVQLSSNYRSTLIHVGLPFIEQQSEASNTTVLSLSLRLFRFLSETPFQLSDAFHRKLKDYMRGCFGQIIEPTIDLSVGPRIVSSVTCIRA